MNKDIKMLLEKVVKHDYCIGCGVCASIEGSPLTMVLNEKGKYVPKLNSEDVCKRLDINVNEICPFANEAKNENELADELFNQNINEKDQYIGYYHSLYAGYVKDTNYRKNGSSGGIATWLSKKLLDEKLVDGIIHVSESNGPVLFEYKISEDYDSLLKGSKSKYYPVEMSKVLKRLILSKKRYALIGVPCFIKAVRLLANKDSRIKKSIPYFIGLVCGHLKSDFYAKSIGWELDIEPFNLSKIDFRVKISDREANNYGIEVTHKKNPRKKISNNKDLFVTDWGQGMFKYNACDFCDDVLAETADVTLGDAWLPKYKTDSQGTNIIIIRNAKINSLFNNYKQELFLDPLNSNQIFQSQVGGFRHRRMGLAYRLFKKDEEGVWRPDKRVRPSNKMHRKFKNIFDMRSKITIESFKFYREAMESNKEFDYFKIKMQPTIKEYTETINSPRVKDNMIDYSIDT